MMENTTCLKIPLYKLYYIDKVSDFAGFTRDDVDALKAEYNAQEIKCILTSLAWAAKNPTFDFTSLLPNLPHTNKDIYIYLCKAHETLSRAYTTPD